MRKLYKLDSIENCYYYHEAWIDDEDAEVVEHFGELGTKGQLNRHKLDPEINEAKNITRVLKKAKDDGFEAIPRRKHYLLMIEYNFPDIENSKITHFRSSLMDRLDELLGWVGVGHCDGGGIEADVMDICCLVVDFDIAKQLIEKDLINSEYSNYTRIYIENA